MLFAYFDESMSSIRGYEPYISWNTVDITSIRIKNEFTTVAKVVIYFIIPHLDAHHIRTSLITKANYHAVLKTLKII